MLIKTGRWIKKAFIGILLFMLVQVPVLADGYWPWWGETQSDVQVWQHWGALIGLTVVVGIVLLIIYKKVNFEDMSVKKITVSMAVKQLWLQSSSYCLKWSLPWSFRNNLSQKTMKLFS
ncbi:hypothetical protein S101258_01278 [Lactiplantibacillus plantarum subsp. plantarum]|uniref:Uncharacterized protein n=1 Tax=Lactiplantibacillus plantarum subsp. plantarum TaxID=337330 RepID=A0A2S3U6R9_LACPN|nr:hypothetical protein S101258_01278 [Lactiplantibacillus plantarum subsp. plantarum]